ncbi:MAG: Fe-S cluster assembly protein SufD [Acidimicrobiaceae bacterium]|nr:Fe-S cluster assembly protein SufD [Acidimicrobiaceae bacterium]MYH78975.1 Fe-S cluster assembly protein SufD [Acidimicrobiaceae bacterium]
MNPFTTDAARSLPGPGWLAERRAVAAERFAAADPPTAAAEEWRYSAIADFDLAAYQLAGADASFPPDGTWAGVDSAANGAVAAVLDVADGRIVASRGLDELSKQGVQVGPLVDASDGAEVLGSVADEASDYFTVLNDAFAGCPILVDVPAGVTVEGVIAVRHYAGGVGAATFPRLVVRVGSNGSAKVLDMQRSAGSALVVPVVELDVGQAARLGYVNLQQHDHRAWQIAAHTARVERDAALVAASVALGGGYARTRTDTRLVGRGASGDLLSAYFGSGDQILDFRTYQDHAAPDTTSNLLYKGAVGDSARSVYTGLIRVRPNARGTNAFQTNRNLKLSEDAWAESVPNLEIENNDVRCSHASAVGPVDPDQVFYLESRGVPTPVAERLIVSGFFDEVIDGLPVPSVEDAAREALALKLNQMLKAAA